MARVAVEPFQTNVSYVGDELQLVLPKRTAIIQTLFMTVWLCGWTVGGGFAITQLLSSLRKGQFNGPSAFLLFWCMGWVVGEAMALATIAWSIGGRATAALTPEVLRVRYAIGSIGWTREYAVADIRRLRVQPTVFPGRGGFFPTRGTLAFDYGSKTITFAHGVSEAEAAHVRQTLVAREPTLSE